MPMCCGMRVNGHSAHWIDCAQRLLLVSVLAATSMLAMLAFMSRGFDRASLRGPRGYAHGCAAVDTYTLGGYIQRMRNEIKTSCLKRLNRIEGQVRGLARMVEEDRYCIDVVTQLSAVRSALKRVEEEILRDHVSHCVEGAIASGDKAQQRKKIDELMNVLARSQS